MTGEKVETVHVSMPLHLTPEMIKAVRAHPTTKATDKDDEHTRIGWLLCAWDVLVANRPMDTTK